MTTSPQDSTRLGGRMLLAAFLATGFAQLASQLIAGRILGPVSYSVVATAVALMSLAGIPLVGLQLTTSAHVTAGGPYRPLLHRALIAGVTVGAAFALLSPVIAAALNMPLTVTLLSGALFIPTTFALAVLRGATTGQGRSMLLASAMFAAATVRVTLTTIGSARFGVLAATMAAVAAEATIAFILYRKLREPAEVHEVAIPPTRTMLAASTATTAGWFIANVDLLWARRLLDEADAGVYLVAASTALGLVSLGQATLWHNASRVVDRSTAIDVLRRSTLTVLAAAVVFTPIGAVVMPYLLGEGYSTLPSVLVATAVSSLGASALITTVSVVLLIGARIGRGVIGAVVFAVLAPPTFVSIFGATAWALAGAATASALVGVLVIGSHVRSFDAPAPSDEVVKG